MIELEKAHIAEGRAAAEAAIQAIKKGLPFARTLATGPQVATPANDRNAPGAISGSLGPATFTFLSASQIPFDSARIPPTFMLEFKEPSVTYKWSITPELWCEAVEAINARDEILKDWISRAEFYSLKKG